MITVQGLRKSYGKVEALKDVSFSLKRGEIVALLGGNGSGKSTSINILTGLLKADAGTVAIDDINPFNDPVAARQKIGVFPDKAGLFPNLTVREHLKFFGGVNGLGGRMLDAVVDQTINSLEIEDLADRLVKGFSQGQTVKTALARATVHQPEFLVLDEPSRGLDVYAVRQLRDLLLKLKEKGVGILFSSHVMQEIEILADRVVIIADGVVRAEGTCEAIKAEAGTDNLEDAFLTLAERSADHVS